MYFKSRILVFGYGSVSQCFTPLLIKFLGINPSAITIIDKEDKSKIINQHLSGVTFVQKIVDKTNFQEILHQFLQQGDILVDLGLNISTLELLEWCNTSGVHFLNSALVSWNSDPIYALENPQDSIFENTYLEIQKIIKSWSNKVTAVVTHGANPGLSAHFLKKGLCDIAAMMLQKELPDKKKKDLQSALENHDYAKLCYLEGISVIHFSEYDAHLINKPKQINEFVNTWSVSALIQECLDLAQLGWGTHEKTMPKKYFNHKSLAQYIILPSRGLETYMYSWVPTGEIIGMVVPHEDIFECTVKLSLYENKKLLYCPTICYVYRMCDAAIISLYELAARRYIPQDKWRIISSEITDGYNQMGCLLMGHEFGAWWTGSTLTMDQTNSLVPGQNACTMQVAAGLFAGFEFICKNPNAGVCFPFDLNYEELLASAKPFLGTLLSEPVNWSPLALANVLRNYKQKPIAQEDQWQFTTFLHKEIS